MAAGALQRSALGTRTGLTLLAMVSAAVAIHMAVIRAVGGLEAIPFPFFGACQYAPGLLTLLLVGAWRPRMAGLLRTWPGVRPLARAYLVTATTLSLCILVPCAFGHQAAPFAELAAHYRLRAFVPGAFHGPVGFPLFIASAAPVLHLVNALGEEVFWRGYLLDWLEARLPGPRAWAADGLHWGLWHTWMITLIGWDFPGRPALGVMAIAGSQVFWSLVLCHATRRTRSLWTATVMHATANAMTVGLFDTLTDPRWNLVYSPWGVLGGALMAAWSVPIYLGRTSAPTIGEPRDDSDPSHQHRSRRSPPDTGPRPPDPFDGGRLLLPPLRCALGPGPGGDLRPGRSGLES
jgi:membrane protease YdiL (CAAX protease family)